MGSFILRWVFLVTYCCSICAGHLENLRPLRGVLHTTMKETQKSFSGYPTARDYTRQYYQREMRPSAEDVQEAVEEGYRRAQELLEQERYQVQRLRTGMEDLEQSSKFLFSFRRAEPAAKKASTCMGRSMLEASKYIMKKFNLSASDSADLLSFLNSLLDDQLCQMLMPKGCKREEPLRCSPTAPYRTVDGSCNNLRNPKWGSAMTPFVRYLVPAYEDGVDAMRGESRTGIKRLPSPRVVSHLLSRGEQQPPLPFVSLMVMQWGQFVDHDLVHTPEAAGEDGNGGTMPLSCCRDGESDFEALKGPDCRPIDVSTDPIFSQYNRTCMRFVRSLIASKGCILGPREQLNQITAYLDGSAVYGSTPEVARVLRTFQGGHLNRTQSDLALNRGHLLPEVKCPHSDGFCFKAGDERVNEQPGLASMHTLWLRVHEGLVRQFANHNPQWDDETLYQESRRVVSALIQQITYREFLPVVLGDAIMREYDLYPSASNGYLDVYDPRVDASIANVFATAAYRFGHTLVNDVLKSSGGSIPLLGNFMKPHLLHEDQTRPSALLEGLVNENSQPADTYLVPTLTNKLFAGVEDRVGLDLMALNIQRGRDHGIPPYNAWRVACDLPPVQTFSDLIPVMSQSTADVFKDAYRSVEDIDLFPAGLAEKAVQGGILGPTFSCILGQQFANLKNGDRFWYERESQPKRFSPEQLRSIHNQNLASVMCQHTDIEFLQPQPFFTTTMPGNRPRPCSSYPKLDTRLWTEIKEPEGPLSCQGVGVWRTLPGIDEWCALNCFHSSPFCPQSHCQCSSPI